VPPPRSGLPRCYAETLGEIKRGIQQERLRVVMSANSAMVLLYWDIGRMILDRQEREGWGARVIDRLSADLRGAYPDMHGLSPRNLKYMRAFAAAWPEHSFVQQVAAQIPWFHNCVLIDRVPDASAREWYIDATLKNGWSRNILELQIDRQAHKRQGKAVTNFKTTLPPVNSDMAEQVFKDPYLFDFLGTADPSREREVEQALVDHSSASSSNWAAGLPSSGARYTLNFLVAISTLTCSSTTSSCAATSSSN
jgi:predicted nuclease of restriction endonuclease-like (RecB) superfamily